ncbi:MAG: HlyD family efflux transporter periplasmic adaptor subunit [Planctomycetia bacterium]|nr:HlyD family efflux transporter periplasmic adaptor subunit [Planctomycetia bacterium]
MIQYVTTCTRWMAIGALWFGLPAAVWSQTVDATANPAPTNSPCVLLHCLVMPGDEAEIAAQEAGVIAEIKAKEGSPVHAGELLARIDDQHSILDKQLAECELSAAQHKATNDINTRYSKAAADVAEAEYESSQEANKKVANSVAFAEIRRLSLEHRKATLQIEQTGVDFAVAQSEAKSAAVKVASAEHSIQRRHITTPVDGVVDELRRHVGEWVQPGEVVAHVVRIDRLRVEGFVKASEFPRSRIRGHNAIIEIEQPGSAPLTLNGKVTFVSEVCQAAGDYRIHVEVENRQVDGQWILHPGEPVNLRIE